MADDQSMAGVGPAEPTAGATGGGVATVSAPVATRLEIPVGAAIAIGLALAFTIGVGLVPQPVIDFARHAALLRL